MSCALSVDTKNAMLNSACYYTSYFYMKQVSHRPLSLLLSVEVTDVVIPRPMINELVCRGGISHASLKSVCEKAETRLPKHRGDFETKEQKF